MPLTWILTSLRRTFQSQMGLGRPSETWVYMPPTSFITPPSFIGGGGYITPGLGLRTPLAVRGWSLD